MDVDLGAIRACLEAALKGSSPTALAKEIGIGAQTVKNVVAGGKPYAKARTALAQWAAEQPS